MATPAPGRILLIRGGDLSLQVVVIPLLLTGHVALSVHLGPKGNVELGAGPLIKIPCAIHLPLPPTATII